MEDKDREDMESNVQPAEAKAIEEKQRQSVFNAGTEPGVLTPPPPSDSPSDQPWQEWIDQASEFVKKLPDDLRKFLSNYQQQLLFLALLFSSFVAVRITLAVLDAINGVPLLAPMLELVGLGYTSWFVYRYLWRASTRSELVAEFDSLKTQVVGQDSQES